MPWIKLLIIENKAVGVMKTGHVFTIEPMICAGTVSSFTLVSECVTKFILVTLWKFNV